MVTGKGNRRLPPYVSYRTFRNFIDGLQQGMPARIDRSYWGDKFSGSTGTQLMAGVRFLGLTDNQNVPTTRLRQLVSAKGPQKSEALRQVTTESFSFLFQGSFDCQTATYSQLEEAFRGTYQLTGDVTRKCIKFFIGLANDAGIPLSPFVTKKSKGAYTSAGTKKAIKREAIRTSRNLSVAQTTTEVPNRIPWDEILMTKFPSLDPTWPDEVKIKWFEAFDELLRRVFLSSREK